MGDVLFALDESDGELLSSLTDPSIAWRKIRVRAFAKSELGFTAKKPDTSIADPRTELTDSTVTFGSSSGWSFKSPIEITPPGTGLKPGGHLVTE
jgi:hypothetical protein